MLPFQGGGLGAARGAQGAVHGMMIYCPFRAIFIGAVCGLMTCCHFVTRRSFLYHQAEGLGYL